MRELTLNEVEQVNGGQIDSSSRLPEAHAAALMADLAAKDAAAALEAALRALYSFS